MTRSRAVLAVLALLLATSLMFCPSTAQGQGAAPSKRFLSTPTHLRVRSSPSSNSVPLFVVPPATVIEVGRCSNGWCAVSRVGQGSGWVEEEYLAHLECPMPVVRPDPRATPLNGVPVDPSLDSINVATVPCRNPLEPAEAEHTDQAGE